MQSEKLAGTRPTNATIKYLDIAEIKEDTVVMKDGTLRAVVLVSSINFALKSEEEQNAIIYSYMSFINAFDFPLQIVIQSRKLDIKGYLERLAKSEKEQTNELLRMQIASYRQYISELVEIGEIMTKRFYVVVPYNPAADMRKSFFRRLWEVFTLSSFLKLREEQFKKYKNELQQRVSHVMGLLGSIGLGVAPLDTQGLIELYYTVYNPETSAREPLVEVGKMRVE